MLYTSEELISAAKNAAELARNSLCLAETVGDRAHLIDAADHFHTAYLRLKQATDNGKEETCDECGQCYTVFES